MMKKNLVFLLLCTLPAATLAWFVPSTTNKRRQPLTMRYVLKRCLRSTSSSSTQTISCTTFPSVQRSTASCLHVSHSDQTKTEQLDQALDKQVDEIETLEVSGEIDTREADDEIAETQEIELWEDDSKNVELVLLLTWGVSISAFVLYNNFIGPWPMPQMEEVPERFWRTIHVVSGMLFGGGIILTTCIEWLVASNKNPLVLQFWYDKVPLLDAAIVLPALTASIVSGTGLAIENYGGLGTSPVHIAITFYALVAFASWWAATDLTTQGKTLVEVNEWVIASTNDNTQEIPKIIQYRRFSNVVSCLFVVTIYAIMVLKPGVIYWKDLFPSN